MEGHKNSGATIPFGSRKDQIDQIMDAECNGLLNRMCSGANKPLADQMGISVALFYPGDSSIPTFYRYGNAGPKQEITDSTVFAMGSVTKAFTATIAAILSAQNVIDPIGEALVGPYFPLINQPSSYWDAVTFLDFATQTSGMPDKPPKHQPSVQLFDGDPPSGPFVDWWNAESNQNEWSHERQLGNWIYSNPGFVTLGFACVAAAQAKLDPNTTYADLLAEITGPLGMQETFVGSFAAMGITESIGHADGKEVQIKGAVDLKSSARDMHAFMAGLYEAMQLSAQGSAMSTLQQGLAAATKPWITNPKVKSPFVSQMGLGWQISNTGFLNKNGGTSRGGSSCDVQLSLYREGKQPIGIALMTNQVGAEHGATPTAASIVDQIAQLVA